MFPALRASARREIARYFEGSDDVNYIALSLGGERGRESSSTLFHEYTHLLLCDYFRAAPAWLKEGLAEFYSTFKVEKDDT